MQDDYKRHQLGIQFKSILIIQRQITTKCRVKAPQRYGPIQAS